MKRILTIVLLAAAWCILPQAPVFAQRFFASPDEAVKVLQAATQAKDKTALREIFGPEVKELLTGDEVQDAKNAQKFASVMAQGYTLVNEGDDKITIEVGPDSWPMPIPLVKANGQWHFDTAAGKEEIINRHIGKDELHAIGVCQAYASAHGPSAGMDFKQPFHGYYFRILHGQYLVAYPSDWDHSGIMTFIAGQDGKVYQKNLGQKTFRIARAMKGYKPDSEWILVQDKGIAVPEQ